MEIQITFLPMPLKGELFQNFIYLFILHCIMLFSEQSPLRYGERIERLVTASDSARGTTSARLQRRLNRESFENILETCDPAVWPPLNSLSTSVHTRPRARFSRSLSPFVPPSQRMSKIISM